MSYKTITPIVSTILLVLLTIVVSTAAYFWMIDIQEQIQSDVTGQINDNTITDRTDFEVISVSCNATSNQISMIIMNSGTGDISAGTAVLELTSVSGVILYTNITSSIAAITEGSATTLTYISTYDLIDSTTYVTKLTLSNSKTRSRSCLAAE